MNTIQMENEYGVTYESTVFAKRGQYEYSVGLSEPNKVMIACSVLVGDARKMTHGYYFPQVETENAVNEFFNAHALPTGALLTRVKEIVGQYYASNPELVITIPMPIETPYTEEPAPEEPGSTEPVADPVA